jgi:hypothetical protein
VNDRTIAFSVDRIVQLVTIVAEHIEWREETFLQIEHLAASGDVPDRRFGILNPNILTLEADRKLAELTPC